MDVERQYVTVDGVTLAYEEYGAGNPVVFIHGFPASSYSWRQAAQALSDSHRTVCFDLMGFGYSDKPLHADYSIERQTELIIAAMGKLQLRSVILVGHSIGGAVCLAALRRLGADQSLVSGLVLVNSVCYLQELPWFMRALLLPALPTLAMKLIPERWGFAVLKGWMYHPKNGMSREAAREYAARLQSPRAHEALIAVAECIIPDDIDELVASYTAIRVPTLIIWGRQDRVIPLSFARRLADDIPRSTLCELNQCGHCPQEEKPEETIKHLRQFVEQTGLG
jgi:pimeloyl-ACP methyl ester carboxylesterase